MRADVITHRALFLTCSLALFRSRLASLFATRLVDVEQLFLAELVAMVNEGMSPNSAFTEAEATAACEVMTEANEIMLSEGIVYRI